MSPSATFWVNTLTSLGIFLTASTLLLFVLASGVRRRLNLSLSVLATSTAIVGLGLAVSSLSFWLNSRALENGAGFGEPLFWMELAAAGFYFMGPALLTFAIIFSESPIRVGKANQGIQPPRTRLSRLAAIVGYLIGLGLLPAIFSHRVLAELYMDRAEILRLKLTDLGYVASAGPILLQLLALLLFWRNRKHLCGWMLASSTTIWIIGSIFVIVARSSFPIASLTLCVSALLTSYAVFKHRIIEPALTPTQRLKAEFAHRTDELEQIRDRLQHFHTQQHAVGQICRALGQIADPTSMLQQLPSLIHEHLGYQHVYLYEPDTANQHLVVRAAAGSTAETVLESAHERRSGRGSLVGQVAAQRQPRVAETPGEEAVYFTGTALPGARAELAVPLIVGDRLLGVLDLQSIHLGAFSEEDLAIMTALIDQVSITLDQAGRLQEAQSTLADLEKIPRRYWHHAPDSRNVSGPEKASAYVYNDGGGVTEISPKAAWTPEMSQSATLGPVLSQDGDSELASLSLPIVVQDQVIGAMQLRHKSGRKWQPEEIDALGKVTERLGLAVEARRLSLEAQQRSAHEHVIGKITDEMQQATDMETLMQITANELKQALGGSRAYVHLGTDSSFAPSDRGQADRGRMSQ